MSAPHTDPRLAALINALAEFNEVRQERDAYEADGDWDTGVLAFDESLANLGDKLAAAVSDLLGGPAVSVGPTP